MNGSPDIFFELVESSPRLRSMKDVPRTPLEPRFLQVAAFCAAAVSVFWAVAPFIYLPSLGTYADTSAIGLVITHSCLLLVPLAGLYLSVRVLLDSERIGEMVALSMLHALFVPISYGLTPLLENSMLGSTSGHISTIVNIAVLVLLRLDCRRWERF